MKRVKKFDPLRGSTLARRVRGKKIEKCMLIVHVDKSSDDDGYAL